MKNKKIKVLHLINHIQNSGSANLLYSQIPYLSNNVETHIGYLLGDEGNFRNLSKVQLVKFPIKSFKNIFNIFKILKYIRNQNIDIIHTHLLQASLIGRIISKFYPDLKNVVTKHSVNYLNPNSFLYKIENRTIKYSDAIICISNYVKSYLLDNGVPEKKLYKIYNGIDYDYFSSIGIQNSSTKTIGTVAMLTKQKGIDILLKAIKKNLTRWPSLKIDIVGDGPLMMKLQKLSSDLNIQKQVEFTGKLPHDEVRARMSKWRALILPSRWEAFGLVIAEANAVGIPVIATKVGAIPEIIKDGKNGFLIEPDNICQLKDRINYILTYPTEAYEMGVKGQNYIKKFDIKLITKEKEKLYNKLMKN